MSQSFDYKHKTLRYLVFTAFALEVLGNTFLSENWLKIPWTTVLGGIIFIETTLPSRNCKRKHSQIQFFFV